MELKFKNIMVIAVLLGLVFPCYAEDEPEPNKPTIVNADLPSENSEVAASFHFLRSSSY